MKKPKCPAPMIVNVRGFIDPRWWNSRPQMVLAETKDDQFKVGDHTLFLAEDSVPDGTELKVNLQTFRAYIKSEKDEWDEYVQFMKDHNQTVENFKQAIRRLEAERFNASIGKCFRWVPAIKEVLSGLSEKSMGNGSYRNTVVHIMVAQNWLKRGRFRRERGQYLCTQPKGRFKGVSPEEWRADDRGERYGAKVTCQACIDRARKIDQADKYRSPSLASRASGDTQ